jgi:hypothetical protein
VPLEKRLVLPIHAQYKAGLSWKIFLRERENIAFTYSELNGAKWGQRQLFEEHR